jgi:DNA-binding NarL/FixJ family response regulator
MIKVVIISKVRVHREGLAALLQGWPSIEVLGADCGQGTQIMSHATATDVALIDAPPTSATDGGAEILGVLRKQCARIRVLAVGIREAASEVLACAAAGIDGLRIFTLLPLPRREDAK